jgi:hypothetical protein
MATRLRSDIVHAVHLIETAKLTGGTHAYLIAV